MALTPASPWEEARWAEEEGADYLGVGAVYGSKTKSDAGPPIGLAGLRHVVRATTLPVIAIGSIRAENIGELMDCGIHGVAVLSAVSLANDPTAAVQGIAKQMKKFLRQRGQEWPGSITLPR